MMFEYCLYPEAVHFLEESANFGNLHVLAKFPVIKNPYVKQLARANITYESTATQVQLQLSDIIHLYPYLEKYALAEYTKRISKFICCT